MRNKTELKICFAASTGGHMEQLLMLKPLMAKYKSFILTERTEYCSIPDDMKTYFLMKVNRKKPDILFKLPYNCLASILIFLKEKPDIVVTTGVLAVIPFCFIVKVFGGKLVYIESFAKINSGTRTGRLLYRIADRFYVQWESMLSIYPNAVFLGGIY